MPIAQNEQERLVRAALEARESAYSPYSRFRVGAALLTESGIVHRGCNVENASYGLTICAERMAVGNAVSAGVRLFRALAVAASGGATPCGACRQVLAEFCQELPILVIDADAPRNVRLFLLSDLLPQRFGLGNSSTQDQGAETAKGNIDPH